MKKQVSELLDVFSQSSSRKWDRLGLRFALVATKGLFNFVV
jgi:hypothetical protein